MAYERTYQVEVTMKKNTERVFYYAQFIVEVLARNPSEAMKTIRPEFHYAFLRVLN